jgi:Protein of unknown function DUF262
MPMKVDPSSQSLSWFNDHLKDQRLIFKPPFQRNPVWLDKQKAYLIDTALRNLPIPEIYFQKDTDEHGREVVAVVDGQQRLRALLGFPRGEVELMDVYTPGRGGDTWDALSDDEKKNYWKYRLVTREISDATDADLRDLFQRLNQNTMRLTAQEIRNARYKGEFIQTVTDLADEPFWAEHRIVTANEIRRMADIEFMAELLVGIMWGPQNKKTILDSAFTKFEEQFPGKRTFLSLFETARDLTKRLVPDLSDSRWRGKSDYYSLFLALAELSTEQRIAKSKTKDATAELKNFGEQVTSRLTKEGARKRAPQQVNQYATAVEKAASDKDRRETRHRILVGVLRPYFSKA